MMMVREITIGHVCFAFLNHFKIHRLIRLFLKKQNSKMDLETDGIVAGDGVLAAAVASIHK